MSDSIVIRTTCRDCGDELGCSVTTSRDELSISVERCGRCTDEASAKAASDAVTEYEKEAGL